MNALLCRDGRTIVDDPASGVVVDFASADAVAEVLPWHDGRAVCAFGRAWAFDPGTERRPLEVATGEPRQDPPTAGRVPR